MLSDNDEFLLRLAPDEMTALCDLLTFDVPGDDEVLWRVLYKVRRALVEAAGGRVS